jgi:TolB-like protein
MSRTTALLLALTLSLPAMAAAPSTQPTTAPVAADVLVLPFTPVSTEAASDPYGHAIQQNLITDLGRGHFHPAAGDDTTVTPVVAGRDANARYVIAGSYQTVEGLFRFTGQIVDVRAGSVVGGMTATGGPRDLFAIEDSLSAQALHQLQKLNMQPVAANAKAAPAAQAPAAAAAPAVDRPAPVFMRAFEGSDLQQYANGNRTPSQDYAAQVRASANRQTYWTNGYGGYGAYSYGYPWSVGYTYPYDFAYGYTTPFVAVRMTPQRATVYGNNYSQQP